MVQGEKAKASGGILQNQKGFRIDELRLTPEKRLMLAVLCDALGVYTTYFNKTNVEGIKEFYAAEGWFVSSNKSWPFSFLNICDVLGIDSGYVHRILKQWRRAASKGKVTIQRSRPRTHIVWGARSLEKKMTIKTGY